MLGVLTTAFFTLSTGHYLQKSANDSPCRSNQTHLCWNAHHKRSCFFHQPLHAAKQEATAYLRRNVMDFDVSFLETMGFFCSDDDDDAETTKNDDGLADGMVGNVVDLAIQAKIAFEYTDALPQSIWNEYVLNYASLNEGRTNIRRLLFEKVITPLLILQDTKKKRFISETVQLLNAKMWNMLFPNNNNNNKDGIVFVSGQTPAILDPMSVIAFGHASCTGLSILLVEACRAAGIAARVAGTAAWNGDRRRGNHSWVEVWNGQEWKFLEPSPNQQTDEIDTIDRDPCARWFCNEEQMRNTRVFAARLDRDAAVHFPLAWERTCVSVPGEDRTAFYQSVCSCSNDDESAESVQ